MCSSTDFARLSEEMTERFSAAKLQAALLRKKMQKGEVDIPPPPEVYCYSIDVIKSLSTRVNSNLIYIAESKAQKEECAKETCSKNKGGRG